MSAVDCVQPALQHTRAQLFNPFRWGQWSRLALVGILAAELHVGGCGLGNLGGEWPRQQKDSGDLLPSSSLPHPLAALNPHHIPANISAHIAQFLALIVVAALALFVLMFVFLYVSSVFRFILFDSVVKKQCSIGEGWQLWHRSGRRFFLWQLVFLISTWLCMGVLIGVPLAFLLAGGWTPGHMSPRFLLGIILIVALLAAFALVAAAVQVMAKDFLVPIMALEGLDFADGWSRLLGLVRVEPGKFGVYLLLKLVLAIAAGILFTIIAIVPAVGVIVPAVMLVLIGKAAGLGWTVTTISLAVIIGTVLLLILLYLVALVCVPATVFFPAFSIYFFASRYPALDALVHPAPPIVPPVVAETPPPEAPPSDLPPLPPSPEPIG